MKYDFSKSETYKTPLNAHVCDVVNVARWVKRLHSWLHRPTQSSVHKVAGCWASDGGTDFVWEYNHPASWYVFSIILIVVI